MTLGSIAAHAGRLVLAPLAGTVFPERCCHCERLVASPLAGPLCERCAGTLRRPLGPTCACGFPLVTAGQTTCGRCRRGLNPLPFGTALGSYDGTLRSAILALKYRGRRRAASQLGRLLAARKETRALVTEGCVVVPVPLHPQRERQRGFNQSALVAATLGRLCGARSLPRALTRRRDTPSQTGLTAAARRANVAGAFVSRQRAAIHGRVVVLVDDVVTTGATARACAGALLDAGAREVRLVTLARAL